MRRFLVVYTRPLASPEPSWSFMKVEMKPGTTDEEAVKSVACAVMDEFFPDGDNVMFMKFSTARDEHSVEYAFKAVVSMSPKGVFCFNVTEFLNDADPFTLARENKATALN